MKCFESNANYKDLQTRHFTGRTIKSKWNREQKNKFKIMKLYAERNLTMNACPRQLYAPQGCRSWLWCKTA